MRSACRRMAITDRDGVYGAVKAHVKAKELGIKLLVGAELTVTPNLDCDVTYKVLLLARTRAGYGGLCGLISRGRDRIREGQLAGHARRAV